MTIAIIVLCAVGVFFSLSGTIGILRMPDVYTRIQCSTKTITLGALPLLVALALAKGVVTTYGARALIIGVLLLIVNPVASHALIRAAYKTGVPMWRGSVIDEVDDRRHEQDEPGERGAEGGQR